MIKLLQNLVDPPFKKPNIIHLALPRFPTLSHELHLISCFQLHVSRPGDLTAKRSRPTTLTLGLVDVRLVVHLDRLRMVVAFVSFDLLAHGCDVLVYFCSDTVDAGFGERDTGAVRRQMCGAARGTLQSAAGNLDGALACET